MYKKGIRMADILQRHALTKLWMRVSWEFEDFENLQDAYNMQKNVENIQSRELIMTFSD